MTVSDVRMVRRRGETRSGFLVGSLEVLGVARWLEHVLKSRGHALHIV